MFCGKVLITGGSGFIGSHIAEKLSQFGYSIIIVDNLYTGLINNISHLKNIKFYNISIEKDELKNVFEIEKPDYCIHLAAQVSVDDSCHNPKYDAQINIAGSINVIELCKKYHIKKFIAASTAAVYGNPLHTPVAESHQTEPLSPYGLSKLTMEKYIKMIGVPYIIFRFSNVFGSRQKSTAQCGVISIFSKAMQYLEPVKIYGDGEQIRDFVYVDDIANIFVKSISSDICNETLNFSTNKGITINQLFNIMSKIYDYKKEPLYLPQKEGDIKLSILSNEKVKKLFLLSEDDFTPFVTALLKLKEYNLHTALLQNKKQ